MTVYADVLFLVNFSMDFLTLYITGRAAGKCLRKSRLIAAAGIGGTVGTVLLAVQAPEAAAVLIGLLLSVLMTRIAFGTYQQQIRLLRDSVMVWGAGALLGGVMTFVTSLGEPTAGVADTRFPEAFALCFGISLLLMRLFSTSRGQKSQPITLETAGISLRLEALCDTGSFAADPMTGMPTILVRREALGGLAELLEREDCPLRLRMIPVSGVGGSRLLRGFVPDRLSVGGEETAAVIASCGENRFRGFDALLPAALCGRGSGLSAHHIRKNTEE